MKLGFLYAGQGSQHPGMGADLYKAFPAFRKVLDSAAQQVDFDLKEVSFTDRAGVLNQTRFTQPCMVAFAAGMTALLAERGIVPSAAAGLSLGEYSALHAAGVFDADTAVELVAFRGKAMEEAAAGRPSAMVAVLGLDRAALQEACDEASAHGCVVIANYNCPGQLVLGGEKAAVETAAALAKEKGARRCLPLKVSGPFHTPLMAPAGDALAERFRTTAFHEPRIPVIFNCLGVEKPEGITITELLVLPAYQRQGIGSRLLRLAAAHTPTLLYFGAQPGAEAFYEKNGCQRSLPSYLIEPKKDGAS